MKRPEARLLVMLDVVWERNQVVSGGLEGFLAKYGVRVTNDIVLSRWGVSEVGDATACVVGLARACDPAMRRALSSAIQPFTFLEARSVNPVTPSPGGYTVAPLLYTLPGENYGQWAEPGLSEKPNEFIRRLAGVEGQAELRRRITNPTPVAVAVTVRENKAPPPEPGPAGGGAGPPRMVVIGEAKMATNYFIERGQEIYYELVVGSLGWLRDKPDIPVAHKVAPKARKSYRLNLTSEEISGVRWLPMLAMLVGIIACGIGVGMLRRR
jgi:hypothetical protein